MPGWWVPAIGTERACCLVGCLDGVWAGLEKKSWTRAVNAGNCQAKVGRVSAQDAQYAAGAVAVADWKPKPP